MKMMFYHSSFIIFLALVIVLLSGCSDDQTGKATGADEKVLSTPSMELPQHSEETKQIAGEAESTEEGTTLERPLLIGVVGPETGEDADYGLSVLDGILAAARHVNAQGGIAGKEIKVIHKDDKNNISLTNEIVPQLISQGAIAILTAPTGSSTFAPVHLANTYQTILVSIGSRRHIERSGPYIFRMSISDELATEDLIEYASAELGYINYAMVTSSIHEFSLDLSALFKKALAKYPGAIKLETDSYDSYTGMSNIKKVVDEIKACPDPLQGVIFTGEVNDGVVLAKALAEAGLSLPIIGGEDLFKDEYLEGGDAVNGTLLYASFSPGSNSSRMAEFVKEYGKDDPDRFAALGYDAFMLVAEAIKVTGSTNTSRVREALINQSNFEGVTGKTSFTSDGGPVKHPIIYEVKKSGQGRSFVVLKQ